MPDDAIQRLRTGIVGQLKLIFYTIVSEVIDYQHVAVLEMAS